MIERGHLGNHPADPDPSKVGGCSTERLDKGRCVRGEIAQGIRGSLW